LIAVFQATKTWNFTILIQNDGIFIQKNDWKIKETNKNDGEKTDKE